MEINIKKILKDQLTPNDIIINDATTYPEDLTKLFIGNAFCIDDFQNYFFKNTQYHVVGVHFTRLLECEIENIKTNGLHSDDDNSYLAKIHQLPSEFDKYKPELIKYVRNPLNKRSNGCVYFDIGKIEIYYGNSVFLKHWGGETLYCYYDKFCNTDKNLIRLGNRLREISIPCIVIVKVNAYKFFVEFLSHETLIESIVNNELSEYKNEACLDSDEVTVIDVIPVKYLKRKMRE